MNISHKLYSLYRFVVSKMPGKGDEEKELFLRFLVIVAIAVLYASPIPIVLLSLIPHPAGIALSVFIFILIPPVAVKLIIDTIKRYSHRLRRQV